METGRTHDASILPVPGESPTDRRFSCRRTARCRPAPGPSASARPRHRWGKATPSGRLAVRTPSFGSLRAACGRENPVASTLTDGNAISGGREFSLNDATLRIPDHRVAIDFARHDEASLAEQGLLDFCAFDPSTPDDGFAENLDVIVVPVPPGLDRGAFASANLAQFGQAGSKGQADVLFLGGKFHSVTFTACPATAESFLDASDSIMRGYRPR